MGARLRVFLTREQNQTLLNLRTAEVSQKVKDRNSRRVDGQNPLSAPIINERQRQTYFGALNYYTQEFLIKPCKKGDSSNAIAQGKIFNFPVSKKPYCFDLGWR